MKTKEVDVLIIAEGTYPYIRGGVSTWIHQILTGMPDIRFGILFLGSREEDYGEIKYQLPPNLVFFETFYMFSKVGMPPKKERSGSKEVERLLTFFTDNPDPELFNPSFYEKKVSFGDFLYSKETWFLMEELYFRLNLDIPFVDFFWTIRNILTPLWSIVKVLEKLEDVEVKLVHSPSTGYAGFVGAMIKKVYQVPFLITEHGIYTKERKIDIIASRWIKSVEGLFSSKFSIDPLRELWIRFFVNLGKICYMAADKVYSLFEGARQIQIELGCPPEKTQVIPNGVDVHKLKQLRRNPDDGIPPIVALIGRVTPIKDIKTFIKAMRILVNRMPEAEGWIVGPEDENPDYAQECRTLVSAMNLENKVKFLGFKRLEEVLPHVGLVTLTSISEGMPMVVLEAFAAGVPCVTTDVGSCSQLIYGGLNEEDEAIGRAGEVVNVGDAIGLARAYEKLLKNKEEWTACRKAAIERVESFYSMEAFLKNYREVYETFMGVGYGGGSHRT